MIFGINPVKSEHFAKLSCSAFVLWLLYNFIDFLLCGEIHREKLTCIYTWSLLNLPRRKEPI